ncbi:MAG: glycosyl hydrolase [Opitutaceae bacterium]|jgi:mannan endo-1,4-beta-mannosidase
MRRPVILVLALGILASSATSAFAAAPPPPAQTYEAESGLLLGKTRLARENPDGTGRTFVTGFEHLGDGLALAIKTPAAGFYFLDLGYACGGDKRIPVSVNGRAQGSRFFPKTTGFGEARYGRVFLDAGDNTLRIGTDWTFIDVDFIRLSPAAAPAPFHLSAAPVNPHASPEARQLFTTLTREFGRRTFAGQHDSNPGSLPRLKTIADLTDGAAPAILGLDLLYYSGTWNHPDGDGAIETARDWALHRMGIAQLSWHWLSPGGSREPVWDSFSTLKTLFDVDRLADTSTPEYHAVIADLDRIAEKLKVLRDARVPVLWRPLHEAEGQWFWWGARGPEATKRLYRLMFDRFTRVHHLDNLLWVWTSTDSPAALDWYPGDDLVDIIATDLYAPAGMTGVSSQPSTASVSSTPAANPSPSANAAPYPPSPPPPPGSGSSSGTTSSPARTSTRPTLFRQSTVILAPLPCASCNLLPPLR